jgi:ABC-type antimicrobial peptide transport system permease subunit
MEELKNKIISAFGSDFVIVGGYALYLHGIVDSFSGKDIDIAVNLPSSTFDNQSDYNKHTNGKFGHNVWTKNVDGQWIEAFNRTLPDYDTLTIEGVQIKVESIQSMKDYYNSLDIDNMQGHDNFKNRLRKNKELVNAQ